eukprot:762724-Hanusia_phi.AAC.1
MPARTSARLLLSRARPAVAPALLPTLRSPSSQGGRGRRRSGAQRMRAAAERSMRLPWPSRSAPACPPTSCPPPGCEPEAGIPDLAGS